MSSRLPSQIFLAVLIFLAGCSGFAPNATTTPTATPAPVPTASPSPTPIPEYAPGVTARGVEDARALTDAHNAILANTSYTRAITEHRRYANGTLRWRHTITRRVAPTEDRFHTTADITGNDRAYLLYSNITRYEAYRDGNEVYTMGRNATATRYHRVSLLTLDSRARLYVLLSGLETRTTGTVVRNGTTLYRLEATRVTDSTLFEAAVGARPFVEVRNVTFRALVDGRGFVHEYRLTHAIVAADGTVQREVRAVRFHSLGETTVARPGWYDDAVANTTRG